MAESKLTVTADYSGVIAQAAKAKKANQDAAMAAGEITKQASRAGKAAKGVADGGGGMVNAFGKALLKVDLIKQALSTAGQVARGLINEFTGASMTQREMELSSFSALGTLRAQNITGLTNQLLTRGGSATPQERLSFLQSLGSSLEGTGRRLSDEDISRLTAAFTEGGKVVYGEGGQALIRQLLRGGTVDAAIARTQASRGSVGSLTGTRPFQEQVNIVSSQIRTDRANAQLGFSAETGAARLAGFRANNPIAGAILSSVDALTGGGASALIGSAVSSASTESELVRAIQRNTTELARQRRPALGSQSEGAR